MNSRERIFATLNHQEPDRIPLDIGATDVTGITLGAYRKLLKYLGRPLQNITLIDIVQQVVKVNEKILKEFRVDTRGVFPNPPSSWQLKIDDENNHTFFTDEWGIKWVMPKKYGKYYDMASHPLSAENLLEEIKNYPWPDPQDNGRFKGIKERLKQLRDNTFYALLYGGALGAGMFELALWLRGFENFYCDLATNPGGACALLDKIVDLKIRYWERALEKFGEYIDVVIEWDDLGAQKMSLISPRMYRKYIKPRHRKLFSAVKKASPKRIYIFLHSCGSIYDLIPDLIEVGVDIINPVQVGARKMDPKVLKKKFGKDIIFWGGGVDTQKTLPYGTKQQIIDEVKRRIEEFAPGGGFVFSAIHNIQSDVPAQNIMTMVETFHRYADY
jgi:uroporphyrinogen decarboxylase